MIEPQPDGKTSEKSQSDDSSQTKEDKPDKQAPTLAQEKDRKSSEEDRTSTVQSKNLAGDGDVIVGTPNGKVTAPTGGQSIEDNNTVDPASKSNGNVHSSEIEKGEITKL